MGDFEYGACLSIWFKGAFTIHEKLILKKYEIYLRQYTNGLSFIYEFKVPFITKYEQSQFLKTIGYIPEEEISICALATPLFRAVEAILKFYGGFAKICFADVYKDNPDLKGICHVIQKSNLEEDHPSMSTYQLIDWELTFNLYNCYDPPEIREIYSIQSFVNNKSY